MPSCYLSFVIRLLLRAFAIAAICASLAHAADNRNLGAQATTGAKRVALVIGNGGYQRPDILPKLSNPTHDAEDIAKALRGFGFEVIERKDQSLEGMNSAIAEFSRKIGNSDAALFYFAGHGLQVKGQNYLIPVDANIETEARVQYVSVNVNQVLDEMDSAKSRVNIVMLDACRNNPISGKFRSGASRGLAAPSSQPKGTVIVYATDPGNVAADGEGRNGLFTSGLLAAFKGSDLSLAGVLLRASAEVERGSDQKQTPYINGPATLQQSFQFAGGTQVAALTPQFSGARTREQIEDELWDAIKDTDQPNVLEEYLKQYPKGRYIAQAKVKLAGLKSAAGKPAVSPAPTFAAPMKAENPEDALWSAVEKGNSADDYDAYLGQYPKGKYVALAKQRKQKLMEAAASEARQRQTDTWNAAETGNSEESYGAYLKAYPSGQYAVLAQNRIKKLQADAGAKAEQDAWKKADAGNDKAAVQGYLSQYPAGRYAAAARLKLAQIEKEEAAGPRPGQTFKDCADCPEMVVIPAGSFEMGGDKRDNEKPVHTVRIGRSFAIGRTEVTQGQWRAVMGSSPSQFSSCGDTCPVEQVSWNDAKEFINRLNAKTGKQYRLPSEAEWEYACRAGGRHEYCGSDSVDSAGWYGAYATPVGNSAKTTNPAGRKQANAWGLYDMSGNVWEWVEDCWHDNYNGAPSDGSASTSGCSGEVRRVLRGGSWYLTPDFLRAALRNNSPPDYRFNSLGFRVAR
jgi:formylglycine-generating enzyme required for sulfatase activity